MPRHPTVQNKIKAMYLSDGGCFVLTHVKASAGASNESLTVPDYRRQVGQCSFIAQRSSSMVVIVPHQAFFQLSCVIAGKYYKLKFETLHHFISK